MSLEKGHRPALRFQHDTDGFLEELVLFRAPFCSFDAEVGQLRAELRLRLAGRKFYHVPNFFVRDKCPLNTAKSRCARRQIEHVALPEQLLRAVAVEDGAAVHPGGDVKRDPGGHVGLDQARDHVDRRPLRGEDDVDAHGARLLGQAGDRGLDLLGRRHHEIGQLVDDHDDEGQELRESLHLGGVDLVLESLAQLLRAESVVTRDMADSRRGEHLVPLLHLVHGPAENCGRLLHVRDHRGEEVRNVLELRQLHHLRVDEDELELVGAARHEHVDDDRVDGDGFSRAGRPRDEEVGHLAEVADDR